METVLASRSSVQSFPIPQVPCAPRLQANTWVKLLQLPSAYSFDEALLLCQVALDEWLAWVPDYGEIRLNTKQFYCVGLD